MQRPPSKPPSKPSSRPTSVSRPPTAALHAPALPDRPPPRPPTRAQRLVHARVAAVHPSLSPPLLEPDYSPREWSDCFDQKHDLFLPSRRATFRVYTAALKRDTSLAIVFLHGGGHSALSWALVSQTLNKFCAIIAFDARAHGHSHADDESDLSAHTQVADAAAILEAIFEQRQMPPPRLVMCGHSMGGAIAVRLSAAQAVPNIVGLVVIDVVEGTAMSALPFMSSWLQSRTQSFPSISRAVRYVTQAGHVRNPQSARLSVPPQVRMDENSKRWVWRTRLEDSETYWKGWFRGLSSLFLSVKAAKMLVLASVDRLDKDLMIAQMQGKFQNILIPAAGHTVHEDQPDETAHVLLDYLQRNLFLDRIEDGCDSPIFQQRRPIPPCC